MLALKTRVANVENFMLLFYSSQVKVEKKNYRWSAR